MKMPETVGTVRCTVHMTKRRRFSFEVPLARVRIGRLRLVDRENRPSVPMRVRLTYRARLLVVALRALTFLRVRVDVNVP